MAASPGMIPVSQLAKQCSLPERPDWLAASDTCRQLASSAVLMPDGSLHWRCTAHRGLVTRFGGPDGETEVDGAVYDAVPVRYGAPGA